MRILRSLALAAAIAAPCAVLAQSASNWPTKPVRLLGVSTAGGPTDVLARMLAAALEARYKQSFIVEPRPGGAGAVAVEALTRAQPDGYTLLVSHNGVATEQATSKDWRFQIDKDYATVSVFAGGGMAVVVPNDLPANNIREFIAYAKANPAKINIATVGSTLSPQYVAIQQRASLPDFVMVNYKGGKEATQAVAVGEATLWTATLSDALPLEKSGKLRIIGYTESQRHPSLPSVPTLAESDPAFADYDQGFWFAVFAPPRIAPALGDSINAAIREASRDPEYESKLASFGMRGYALSRADSSKRIANELKEYASQKR